GGHEVDNMPDLAADLASPLDALRPVDDQRRADAAFVGPMLVQSKWRVASVRPAGAVAVIGGRAAHAVEVRSGVQDVLRPRATVEAEGIPLGTRPVIRQE